MRNLKHFGVYFVDFPDDSLMKGKHPALVLHDVNKEGVYILPLTSSKTRYNENNPFAVPITEGGYVLIDKFEKTSRDNSMILQSVPRIHISPDDKKNIMDIFNHYLAKSIQYHSKKMLGDETQHTISIGNYVSFSEDAIKFDKKSQSFISVGSRKISAKVVSIDTTKGEEYVLLTPVEATGYQTDKILGQTIIIRTMADLEQGMNTSVVNNNSNKEFTIE